VDAGGSVSQSRPRPARPVSVAYLVSGYLAVALTLKWMVPLAEAPFPSDVCAPAMLAASANALVLAAEPLTAAVWRAETFSAALLAAEAGPFTVWPSSVVKLRRVEESDA
jgi:hypothetical protein